jgi:predicted kinase
MKKSLIILRGIPGSGKNSFAELLNTKAICSADDWHTHKGKYNWLPQNVSVAHEWCQRKCRRFMKKQAERIVIANTNTTERELQPYLDLARQFGYKIYSVIIENRHGSANIHNVPDETLEKMKNRFKDNILL